MALEKGTLLEVKVGTEWILARIEFRVERGEPLVPAGPKPRPLPEQVRVYPPHFSCSIGSDRARWIAQDLNLAAYRAEVVRRVADAQGPKTD